MRRDRIKTIEWLKINTIRIFLSSSFFIGEIEKYAIKIAPARSKCPPTSPGRCTTLTNKEDNDEIEQNKKKLFSVFVEVKIYRKYGFVHAHYCSTRLRSWIDLYEVAPSKCFPFFFLFHLTRSEIQAIGCRFFFYQRGNTPVIGFG